MVLDDVSKCAAQNFELKVRREGGSDWREATRDPRPCKSFGSRINNTRKSHIRSCGVEGARPAVYVPNCCAISPRPGDSGLPGIEAAGQT